MDIRKAFIHWLGGVTQEESEESDHNSWVMGRVNAFFDIIGYMKSQNSTPADEWARNVWLHANRLLATATDNKELLDKVEKGEI